MFRYCSQFELKMNLQTDTTLNGNFDNFNFDKLHRSFKKYPGFIKPELIRR